MTVEKKIDYMQFTTLHPFTNDKREHKLQKSFMANYKVMRVLPNGMTCHHGHNKSDKWLNIATGKVCDQMSDQLQFVKNVIKHGGAFSRIDFCCTVESEIDMNEFRKWCKDGLVSGALSESGIKSIVNDDTQKSETTYIGDLKKRSKRGIFRAYDKAIEMNLDGFKLTRFELEERKRRADVTARRYADGMDIGDIIRQRVDVDHKKWIEIMGAKSEKLKRYKPEENEEDIDTTWHWLITVVAKTLGEKVADDLYNGLGDGNLELFQKIVDNSYHNRKRYIENLEQKMGGGK